MSTEPTIEILAQTTPADRKRLGGGAILAWVDGTLTVMRTDVEGNVTAATPPIKSLNGRKVPRPKL